MSDLLRGLGVLSNDTLTCSQEQLGIDLLTLGTVDDCSTN